MHILVVGAGAMGSLYGGRLQESGCKVFLVDVWPQHIEAINANGLRIEGEKGVQVVPVSACFAREVKGKADLLIVFTKTFHTEKALESIRHALDDKTVAMTLQNGLGNIELLEKYFPWERIIVGTTNFPSDLVAPGYIRSRGAGETMIMQLDRGRNGRGEAVRKTLNDAGFNCKLTEDIFPFIWEKVAFNAAMNALTAVTGLTVGCLGLSVEGRDLSFQVANEVLSIAELKGIAVNWERVKGKMEEAFIEHFDHQPSMLQDLKAGKMTEIDAINGAVVREAEKAGRTLPANEILCKLVKTLEQAGKHQANL